MKFVLLLGRILFSLIFIIKGMDHFTAEAVQQAASMKVPMPSIAVPLAGVVALLGGLSIMLGYKARLGAWLLILFLISSALTMHRYWEFKDMNHALMHHYCFWKNLSMTGSALIITYFGSGPLSLSK